MRCKSMSYDACSSAKPLWTSISELSPGKSVELKFVRKRSASVTRDSLEGRFQNEFMTTYDG